MSKLKERGVAVITGASSGIGAIYADRLARSGYDLVLVARHRDRLDALAQRLINEVGVAVTAVTADLGDDKDLRRIEALLRSDARITLLVNNAGFGSTAPLLDASVDKMEEMVRLNVVALMRLTYAIVPAFVARNAGTIVNISSIVAVAPELLNGVYGGTKAFVLAFSQSLRHELSKTGVRAQVVLPGGTATEFWDIAGTKVENMPKERRDLMMSADDMVDAAIAGLDSGEFVTIPPLPDIADWDAFEAARLALRPGLLGAAPAKRYRTKHCSNSAV
jgi:short-subunit dehydrogenase